MSEQKQREIDSLILQAKWAMYGEEWDEAAQVLKTAKKWAIEVKDKQRIDIILDLIIKARNSEKVPV